MNNEILVVFQCEKWFVYQATWFKAHLLRLFFLKIDVNIIAKSSLSSDSNSDSPKTVKKFQKAYAGKKVIKEY